MTVSILHSYFSYHKTQIQIFFLTIFKSLLFARNIEEILSDEIFFVEILFDEIFNEMLFDDILFVEILYCEILFDDINLEKYYTMRFIFCIQIFFVEILFDYRYFIKFSFLRCNLGVTLNVFKEFL